MLSKRTLKLLCLGFLIFTSTTSAAEEKKGGKEEKKDKEESKKEKEEDTKVVTLDVGANSADHVTVNTSSEDDVVFTTEAGYKFKVLKVGDKTLYTVDTAKFTPVEAHRLKVADNTFFWLKLHEAQPLMFKKKSDTEWTKLGFEEYLDKYLYKDLETKDLDVTKHNEESLFSSATFGSGKVFTFLNKFKVKKVVFDKTTLHEEEKAKMMDVRVYQNPEAKRVFRLNYFYTGDGRFKEVYYKFDANKAVRMELKDVNKFLSEFNSQWPTDYKPVVDRFSPLAVLSSLLIVTFAVFYNF